MTTPSDSFSERRPAGIRRALHREALVIFVAVSLLVAACSDENPGGPDDGEPVAMPSFQVDVRPILTSPTCVASSCHSASHRAGGLSLEAIEPADLIGMTADTGETLVIPFDARASYLVRRLEGGSITEERMPLGRPSLPGSQIGTIRNWIDQGAEDN
jgi:hypothetical protein